MRFMSLAGADKNWKCGLNFTRWVSLANRTVWLSLVPEPQKKKREVEPGPTKASYYLAWFDIIIITHIAQIILHWTQPLVNSANLKCTQPKQWWHFHNSLTVTPCKWHVWIQFHGAADLHSALRIQFMTSPHDQFRVHADTGVVLKETCHEPYEGQSLSSFPTSSLQPSTKSDAVGKLWQTYPLNWWMIHF